MRRREAASAVALTVPATAALAALGLASGNPFLMPLIVAMPAWAAMAFLLVRRRRALALAVLLAWAAAQGATETVMLVRCPASSTSVLGGEAYAAGMMRWVKTGEGPESRPRAFVPRHLLELAAFAALCLVSAGLLGLAAGAVLMGRMSLYVASLVTACDRPVAAALLGWHYWSLLRIASYVALSVLLAEPLLGRVRRYDARYGRRRELLAAIAAGLAADLVLKALGAEPLRSVLRGLLAGP